MGESAASYFCPLEGEPVGKDSRDLEILVSTIQQQLAPDAEVIHDARLPGRKSNRDRQIDVLVRQRIGQYEMLIVLDCKDYARPVDVKGVEEFYGLLDDVGAHKGALVCPKGFSTAAKERAIGLQIDLYSPFDTDPHKWQIRVGLPTICDFRSARMSFGFRCSAPKRFSIPYEFWKESMAFSADMKELGTPLDVAMKKWNEGVFETTPGHHAEQSIYDEPVLINSGYNDVVPVELTVGLWVEQQLYFGHMPVLKMSGFRNELSGKVISNAFTIGLLDPDEVKRGWRRIQSEKELPMPPVLTVSGLVGWALPG
jgi:Restriction endonuclease